MKKEIEGKQLQKKKRVSWRVNYRQFEIRMIKSDWSKTKEKELDRISKWLQWLDSQTSGVEAQKLEKVCIFSYVNTECLFN